MGSSGAGGDKARSNFGRQHQKSTEVWGVFGRVEVVFCRPDGKYIPTFRVAFVFCVSCFYVWKGSDLELTVQVGG